MNTAATTRLERLRRATVVAGPSQTTERSMLDLHSLRRASGMSQADLARRAQISRQRLSAVELGCMQLSVSELLRVQAVLLRVVNSRSAAIHKLLAASEGSLPEVDGESGSILPGIPVTATAENAFCSDFTSLELAMGLVREWQLRNHPTLGMLEEVEAAIDREVPGWAPSRLQVAEKLRVAQERYFRWLHKRQDDYIIKGRLWFRDGLYRSGVRDWNAYLAALLRGEKPGVTPSHGEL